MSTAPPPALPRAARSVADALFRAACQSAALSVIAIAAALIAVLLVQSWPVLSRAGEFQVFTSTRWVPDPPHKLVKNADGTLDEESVPPTFGALAFVYGTLATSAIALALAVPLGVGAAAFLAEVAPARLRRTGSFLVELLAAIPSVVYGFWGLYFLAPGVQAVLNVLPGAKNTGGTGIVAAGLVLAIMVVPYITAVSYDVCRAVPRSQREGALALGATRWQTIRTAVLPYACPGIVAAGFLALGRALGE